LVTITYDSQSDECNDDDDDDPNSSTTAAPPAATIVAEARFTG
jgi:hypothetical protein